MSGGRRCPACGEPLYGWVVVGSDEGGPGPGRVLDRCESCGLGIAHESGAPPLEVRGREPISLPNRRSWQAGLGGGHWAALALAPRSSYPTPEALGLLLDRAGLEPLRLRQPPLGANQLWMWQTLMNAFTFHDGFAVRVLTGRLGPLRARSRLTFAVDAIVSLVAALPVALVSVPLELLAVAARRGGLLEVEVRELRA
ncbi:MAG TPA: hypothetical protein VEK39_04315 [Solirubrobacterales bacterium]|nr:hypothetical protein [Solirubrobacterales bacterium]